MIGITVMELFSVWFKSLNITGSSAKKAGTYLLVRWRLFCGIFGFTALGGWILVEAGKAWFILVLTMLGMLQLAIASVNRQRP